MFGGPGYSEMKRHVQDCIGLSCIPYVIY